MGKLVGYKVGILGGDQREKVMMDCLLKEGAELKVLGDPGGQLTEQTEVVFSINELVKDVQLIIAPMSGTDAFGKVKALFITEPIFLDEKFFALVPKGVSVLIGTANKKVKNFARAFHVNLVTIATREDIGILNAIPTAEGALQIAMEELPITIHGCRSLVFGLGKCGLTLAWRLRALGSNVFGVTRSKEALAKADDLSIYTITYDQLNDHLPQFDLVYNTVPALVLTENRIQLLKRDVLIIDLASAPGGTDFQTAERYGIKALLALGLPGKVAPKTSGQILGRVIPEMILEIGGGL